MMMANAGWHMNHGQEISMPDVDLPDERIIAVADVILLQAVRPRWKILSAELDVYYTRSRPVADLAQRAKKENRCVRVEIVTEDDGDVWVESMVISRERPLANNVERREAKPPREGYLF